MPSGPPLTQIASIVVLNWNGGLMLQKCLRSVASQDLEGVEVVVVDNASRDGSLEPVRAEFPDFRIVSLDTNNGFSGGMNEGIKSAGGRFLLLLNFDVEIEPDYLRICVETLQKDLTLGGVNGKLLKAGEDSAVLDTTGHLVYRNRRAVDRGEWEPDTGQYDQETSVFGVCGAAPCYRREMLEDISVEGEIFDEDFFAYFEDFDLSWRAQLRGWKFRYVPEAVGIHHRGGSGGKASTFILACNHRNRLLTMAKNDHLQSFMKHFLGIAYTELRATAHMLWMRPMAVLMAWWQFAALLPKIWKKRRVIQARRKVTWSELEPLFLPYPYKGTIRRSLERASAR